VSVSFLASNFFPGSILFSSNKSIFSITYLSSSSVFFFWVEGWGKTH
jgi:hypothetical protein